MEELPTKQPKRNYVYWVALISLTLGMILTARFSDRVPIYVPIILLAGCLVMHFLFHNHNHEH